MKRSFKAWVKFELKHPPTWLIWVATLSTTLNFIISLLRWQAHNITLWYGEKWFPQYFEFFLKHLR